MAMTLRGMGLRKDYSEDIFGVNMRDKLLLDLFEYFPEDKIYHGGVDDPNDNWTLSLAAGGAGNIAILTRGILGRTVSCRQPICSKLSSSADTVFASCETNADVPRDMRVKLVVSCIVGK